MAHNAMIFLLIFPYQVNALGFLFQFLSQVERFFIQFISKHPHSAEYLNSRFFSLFFYVFSWEIFYQEFIPQVFFFVLRHSWMVFYLKFISKFFSSIS